MSRATTPPWSILPRVRRVRRCCDGRSWRGTPNTSNEPNSTHRLPTPPSPNPTFTSVTARAGVLGSPRSFAHLIDRTTNEQRPHRSHLPEQRHRAVRAAPQDQPHPPQSSCCADSAFTPSNTSPSPPNSAPAASIPSLSTIAVTAAAPDHAADGRSPTSPTTPWPRSPAHASTGSTASTSSATASGE